MPMTVTMMNSERDSASAHTLLAAFVLGIAGDILFWDVGPFGFGLSIWVALLGIATFMLHRNSDPVWRKTLIIWSCVACVATLNLVFRATEELIPLTLLVLALCAAITLLQARGGRLMAATVVDHLRSLLRVPAQVLLGIMPMLGQVSLRDASISSRAKGIMRGLMMVAPLLLIFIGLFSAADATFERHAARLGDLLAHDTPRHILIVLLIGWVATGLFSCTYPAGASPARADSFTTRTIGAEETFVIMGSLVALFLVFVILQASYLFGSREFIEQTSGLTLANYARRGFFELLVVSVLTLAVLLLMSALQCNQRIFRPLAIALVACVLLILMSAAQRLSLYSDAFGLTLSRVLAIAFMVWLAGNLVSFAVTVLRARNDGFASGLVISGIAAIILLGIANPAAVVARVNLDRAIESGREIDMMYLAALGADAVPVILDRLHELPALERCVATHNLLNGYSGIDRKWRDDWRLWNVSEAAAHRAVTARHDELTDLIAADSNRDRQSFLTICQAL